MKKHYRLQPGEKYGRVTILSDTGRRTKRGKRILSCSCDCGNNFEITSASLGCGDTKSCGCVNRERLSKRGSEHRAWTGGKHKTQSGYVKTWRPDHPNSDCRGYIPEHVLVISEMLGRPLQKGETVHHKNGIKDDNRPENLELWRSNHGNGQRVSDLIAGCREIWPESDLLFCGV